MKRIIAIFLLLAISFSCWACSTKDKKAYELSKSIFENIEKAYEKLSPIGDDIISAWELGINSGDSLKEWREGFPLFCSAVSLTQDEVLDGLASLEHQANGRLDLEYYKGSVREYYDIYFYSPATNKGLLSRYSDTFSPCVELVTESYKMNGDLNEIESLLSSARESLEKLSNNYSDYEHYWSITKYFNVINTYYNFCNEPTGSLEQAIDDLHEYNEIAEECHSSLYYYFQ